MRLSPYKFCSVCGGSLVEQKKILFCENCGAPRYVNSAPTANAVIVQEGRLLLTKRGNEPALGKWDFAGGFLENGEHPRDGLKREIYEELGVNCEVGDFFDLQVCCFPDFYRECMLNLYFLVSLGKGDLVANDDITEVKWWSFADLNPEMMPYLGAWAVVEKVKEKLLLQKNRNPTWCV